MGSVTRRVARCEVLEFWRYTEERNSKLSGVKQGEILAAETRRRHRIL